jgi:hypothetical protein
LETTRAVCEWLLYPFSFDEGRNFYTFYGSRTVGTNLYRIVGTLTTGDEYEKGKLPYHEKIFKNGHMDADINAECEKGFLDFLKAFK